MERARRGLLRAAVLPAAALLALAAGAVLRASPLTARHAATVWLAGLAVLGLPIVWRTLRDATRGHFATDLVATLAITTALLLGEPLAGLVVVLMQSGGEALERLAQGRASRALDALAAAAPRWAHRVRGTAVEDVPAADVRPGDTLLVRPGEMVPCDGVVAGGRSHLDTSALTGEAIPRSAEPGTEVMSGMLNLDGSLTVRATALAAESQYARIVALVRSAQASKAPLVRLADRYATWFTPLTLAVCAATFALTGSWTRVLAVLVVATPCPLILAAPIAIIGGISAAARRQIVVRSGAALERLSGVSVAAFDKTGTLTIGHPEVHAVVPAAGFDAEHALLLAASVEQGSGHLLARTVVQAAMARGLSLVPSVHVVESAGRGVAGEVDGRRVAVGSRAFVAESFPGGLAGLDHLATSNGALFAVVGVDGVLAGRIEFADHLRAGLAEVLDEMRALGIRRTVLLSGDHAAHTHAVARAVGIEEVLAELLPEDKVRAVERLVAGGNRVVMVGDGTNDAPALARATVGIALAAHGGGVTAEAADVIVLADDLGRVPEAIRIGRRTVGIARQSIWVGLGLSGVAMIFAAAGMIAPVVGALIQEAIDVAVILNALRASASRTPRTTEDPGTAPAAGAPRGPAVGLAIGRESERPESPLAGARLPR